MSSTEVCLSAIVEAKTSSCTWKEFQNIRAIQRAATDSFKRLTRLLVLFSLITSEVYEETGSYMIQILMNRIHKSGYHASKARRTCSLFIWATIQSRGPLDSVVDSTTVALKPSVCSSSAGHNTCTGQNGCTTCENHEYMSVIDISVSLSLNKGDTVHRTYIDK